MNAKQFWDDFTFEYVLDEPGLFTDLISIEGYKQAALNLVLPAEWSNQLDRLNRVRAVHGTTALEGNPFSEAEVDLQIANSEQPEDDTAAFKRTITDTQCRPGSGMGQAALCSGFFSGQPRRPSYNAPDDYQPVG